MKFNKDLINASFDILLGTAVIGVNHINRFTNEIIAPTTTTTIDPFGFNAYSNNYKNEIEKDINTYISNNVYGISLIFTGLSEVIQGRFNHYKVVSNVINGACLTASGVNMFCAKDINPVDSIIPTVAGLKHIKNSLLSYKWFNEETVPLINSENIQRVGPVYSPTVYNSL